jgi:hypothetical protein
LQSKLAFAPLCPRIGRPRVFKKEQIPRKAAALAFKPDTPSKLPGTRVQHCCGDRPAWMFFLHLCDTASVLYRMKFAFTV